MNLTAADLFATGARTIGILAILKGIQVFIITFPTLLGLFGHNVPDWALSQQIITLIYPLALLLIGFYLLTGTRTLVEKIYPEEDLKAFESVRTVFKLAMKTTGMVLIVYAVPELLRIISSVLYIGYYQRFGIDASAQQFIAAERSLATLVSLLLGFYLLKSGDFFKRLAFKEPVNDE